MKGEHGKNKEKEGKKKKCDWYIKRFIYSIYFY